MDELELVLFPPNDGNDTDQDDANSDAGPDDHTNIHDIGKGVLAQPIEVRGLRSRDNLRPIKTAIVVDSSDLSSGSDSEEYQPPATIRARKTRKKTAASEDDSSEPDDPEPPAKKGRKKKTQNKKTRKWTQVTLNAEEKFASVIEQEPNIIDQFLDNDASPVDVFREIFDDEILEKICTETMRYAAQKGNMNFSCTKDDILKYFAILILSGYKKLPSRDMYWEQRADTHCALASNAMPRNRFREIHRYFHLNDNLNIDPSDKVYKVRPLLDHLNEKFRKLAQPFGNSFSLDEAMEPYFGHHFMKQFIKGKPIRYGYKIWCLTRASGFLVRFIVYTGAKDQAENVPKQPLGSRVVREMCVNFLPAGSRIFVDNFFNSLSLLGDLKEVNLNCVGTIRSDRIEKAPLKDLKKEARGSYDALADSQAGLTLVRWRDNSDVTVATNMSVEGVQGLSSCKRWSKNVKKEVVYPMPTIVNEYNKHMGGVDMFDQQRALYRIKIRKKCWYWPLIRFMLNGSVVNAWMLFRYKEKNISLIDFTRKIVIALLSSANLPVKPGPSPVPPRRTALVPLEVRFDGRDHLVDGIEKPRRCGNCHKSASFCCLKCNVGLHPKGCFVAFHTR